MLTLVSSPADVCAELASRVRALRLYLGWSQLELAERSGIAFSTLRVFERTGQCSLERLAMIARALNALEGFEGLFRLPEARSLADLDRPQRQRGRRRAR